MTNKTKIFFIIATIAALIELDAIREHEENIAEQLEEIAESRPLTIYEIATE